MLVLICIRILDGFILLDYKIQIRALQFLT